MLQRIQTIYLLIASTLLSITSFKKNFFEFITDSMRVYIHGMGIDSYTLDGQELMESVHLPFGITTAILALFTVFTLFSYKKISRQLRYIRILWLTYLLVLLSIIVSFHFVVPTVLPQTIIHSNYATAFYLLIIGFAFIHLAYLGIRKDKRTIDSLNRLR